MALSDLVPAGVVVVDGAGDGARGASVPPAEVALVAGRPAARRAEFLAGRRCARAALEALGAPVPALVGVRHDRAPDWPDGVVGSLTHGAGEVAAAVAWRRTHRGLGIDVETARPLDPATAAVVASPEELLAAEACGLGRLGPVVVHSAKESVYKAWAPTGGWLEHDDVRVRLAPDGTFVAAVADCEVSGAWELDGGVVRTAAWSPHAPH